MIINEAIKFLRSPVSKEAHGYVIDSTVGAVVTLTSAEICRLLTVEGPRMPLTAISSMLVVNAGLQILIDVIEPKATNALSENSNNQSN